MGALGTVYATLQRCPIEGKGIRILIFSYLLATGSGAVRPGCEQKKWFPAAQSRPLTQSGKCWL